MWLIKAARRDELAKKVGEVGNASLQQGQTPAYLKAAIVRPLLKKPSLNSMVLDNYWPVSSILFWGKILEHVVAPEFQGPLDEADYLFQSGFRLGGGWVGESLFLDLCFIVTFQKLIIKHVLSERKKFPS